MLIRLIVTDTCDETGIAVPTRSDVADRQVSSASGEIDEDAACALCSRCSCASAMDSSGYRAAMSERRSPAIRASESAAAAAALTVGGEVVATEMAEGDVFESENPVRDAGSVCGRGVGADRPADGEDVGVEVDVRAEVDVGDAVHSVRSDLTHVSAEVRDIGEEAVVAPSRCAVAS